jgi:diguanylate cyclase (GGDEF)-like protein
MATQSERAAVFRTNAELTGILYRLRHESRHAELMAIGLDAIMTALGAEGAAIIRHRPNGESAAPEVLHRAGIIGLPDRLSVQLLSEAELGTPALSREANGRPIAIAMCRGSSSERLGLAVWRRRGARAWSGDDVPLMDSLAGVAWLLTAGEAKRHGLAQFMRTDPLTAVLNQRSFAAEASRHIARLDRDRLPGTLMLAEVDNLDSASEVLGSDGGDQILRRAAVLLQSAVRPGDLVGRTGNAEFAIWLSGADHLTAAERAENLCLEAPQRIATSRETSMPEVSFSIGIATRRTGETFVELVRRAGEAVLEVKRSGGGYWRVSLDQEA